ncbi:MAG TPA: hypothetical protein VG797_04645, partial [Phycisphaerales bacterium]|nr:hypothetical protein [Phycisphaerales bacterium]
RIIYLTAEDRSEDLADPVVQAAGNDPYRRDATTGRSVGRAVTCRLDELIFLSKAKSGGGFISPRPPADGTMAPDSADAARIYIGHGLRPAPDQESDFFTMSEQDPTNPAARNLSRPLVAQRRWVSDGDFGQRAGTPNLPFDPENDTERTVNQHCCTGRNEYAGDWMLLRHALMLGSDFTGRAGDHLPPGIVSPRQQEIYAPYIRDLESKDRFKHTLGGGDSATPFDVPKRDELSFPHSDSVSSIDWLPDAAVGGGDTYSLRGPFPRLIRFGRVDACGQTLDSVKRWLEGQQSAIDPIKATAFDGGRWAGLIDEDSTGYPLPGIRPDSPLWLMAPRAHTPPGYLGPIGSPTGPFTGAAAAAQLRGDTMYLLQSAIAGCFNRIQAESEPPPTNRWQNNLGQPFRDTVSFLPVEGNDEMDSHAVLAPRCSNFEIAWSDGSTVPPAGAGASNGGAIVKDMNGDGAADINDPNDLVFYPGDILWYDCDFTRAEAQLHLRRRGADILPRLFAPSAGETPTQTSNGNARPDPEILPRLNDLPSRGFIRPDSTIAMGTRAQGERRTRLLFTDPTGSSMSSTGLWCPYDPRLTGGAPSDLGGVASGTTGATGNCTGGDDPYGNSTAGYYNSPEYLAIWGFRTPTTENDPTAPIGPPPTPQRATYGGAWEKPKLIRIRMTLHDAQHRVAGGRKYEFIFRVGLRSD